MRISDWSSDVCSSDLGGHVTPRGGSDWFESFYQAGQFRLVSIVASFTSASTYLVPPGWSIFVEIVASLTFPIIVAAERKRLLLILLALGVASAFMFAGRSEEHTSELQYLMRNTYAVFCL